MDGKVYYGWGWVDGRWMYVRISGWVDGWTDRWINGRKEEWRWADGWGQKQMRDGKVNE